MNIVFAASECVPFAKTGGLADVVGGLPVALTKLGHSVSVYLPKYKRVTLAKTKVLLPDVVVPFADAARSCAVLDGGKRAGVQFYFIDYPPYFDRDALYGTPVADYPDNAERFALYCRAVLEATKVLGVPEVFHCHDWQAALVPVLLRTWYAGDSALRAAATVMTIHNIGYQGLFPAEKVALLALPQELLSVDKMEFWGKVNFLKGGLVSADAITTVSKKYAQEIQSSEYGFGLEGVLRHRAASLSGILNGVDYKEWDPKKDKLIAKTYSTARLAGKAECKRDLLEQFALGQTDPDLPVLGIVSRFASQKGFDLIEQTADELAHLPLRIIVLGSGDWKYEKLFLRLAGTYPEKFAVKIAYNDALAHKIEAGSDMFLMPSLYEPCGMNQMYSLKYGTVPIVRATGGLDDTVEQWDPATGQGTGFKFSSYSGASLLATIQEALAAYKDRPAWKKLMTNGMKKDFSWNVSAKEYERIYEGLRSTRGGSA